MGLCFGGDRPRTSAIIISSWLVPSDDDDAGVLPASRFLTTLEAVVLTVWLIRVPMRGSSPLVGRAGSVLISDRAIARHTAEVIKTSATANTVPAAFE